uniref:LRAT domain-containing protein n=1 Tax=Dicentrarchus labrax TaxID=13489 RepID=A0A8C4DPG4_DICLA
MFFSPCQRSTARNMKNPILVAVIVLLAITVIQIDGKVSNLKLHILCEQYKFGDIIVFPKKCFMKGARPVYKHYAIYVGPSSEIDIGQGDNDIFHRTVLFSQTGEYTLKTDCRFDKLETTRGKWKERVDNYLDGIPEMKNATNEEDIIKRINLTIQNCREYGVFGNNCEHLATYVRYGLKISLTPNNTVQEKRKSADSEQWTRWALRAFIHPKNFYIIQTRRLIETLLLTEVLWYFKY